MNLIQPISMDLLRRQVATVEAVQTDTARTLALSLFAGDAPWPIPQGTVVRIRFCRADGTGGVYDTLADGSSAAEIQDNTVTFLLPAQVCSCPGVTEVTVELQKEAAILHSFCILVHVQGLPDGEAAEGSVTTASWLPQPAAGAQVGQLLAVSAVSQTGAVTGLEAVDSAGGCFRVNLLEDADSDAGVSADKSYDQVIQAHKAGMACQAVLMGALVLPLTVILEEEGALFFSGFYFDGVNAALYVAVMGADGTLLLDSLELTA